MRIKNLMLQTVFYLVFATCFLNASDNTNIEYKPQSIESINGTQNIMPHFSHDIIILDQIQNISNYDIKEDSIKIVTTTSNYGGLQAIYLNGELVAFSELHLDSNKSVNKYLGFQVDSFFNDERALTHQRIVFSKDSSGNLEHLTPMTNLHFGDEYKFESYDDGLSDSRAPNLDQSTIMYKDLDLVVTIVDDHLRTLYGDKIPAFRVTLTTLDGKVIEYRDFKRLEPLKTEKINNVEFAVLKLGQYTVYGYPAKTKEYSVTTTIGQIVPAVQAVSKTTSP